MQTLKFFQFLPPQIKLILIDFTLFLIFWQGITGKNIENIEKNSKKHVFIGLLKRFSSFIYKMWSI